MLVKGIIDEDFVNYKKPSMFINFPSCSFKCDKECGKSVCQNSSLAAAPTIEVDYDEVIERYLNNPITEAVVIGGLEPFDDFLYLFDFIQEFRQKSKDDIVIYTGYYPEEIKGELYKLWLFDGRDNIIIKFGRFIPDSLPIHDDLLGVDLASCNQKTMRLEDFINGSN